MFLDEHYARIQKVLRRRDPIRVPLYGEEADIGQAFLRGNFPPPIGVDSLTIDGLTLDLKDRVLHERVLFIRAGQVIPIRSHEEVDQEIVSAIWKHRIIQVLPDAEIMIHPGETLYSVDADDGFLHGFRAEKDGLLYVVKALKPEFVEGHSFRVPLNTYKG